MQELDAADARTKETIQALKDTKVEAAIRPDDEPSKVLHDFVDEQSVDGLTNIFRKCIDNTSEAQGTFATSNANFDSDLKTIRELIHVISPREEPAGLSHIVSTFRSLEAHATDMAQLLESLVHHYDLCMTALKHTEGGGEAVQKAAVDLPVDFPVESFHQDAPPLPILPEERLEMMTVLEKDAAEVDEVVQEIRDHSSEMQAELKVVTTGLSYCNQEMDNLKNAIKLLDDIMTKLTDYVQAGFDLIASWNEQKGLIEEKLDELEGLRYFYDGFLNAYEGLLIEVSRRKSAEAKVKKVVHEAMTKLNKLHHGEPIANTAFSSNLTFDRRG